MYVCIRLTQAEVENLSRMYAKTNLAVRGSYTNIVSYLQLVMMRIICRVLILCKLRTITRQKVATPISSDGDGPYEICY